MRVRVGYKFVDVRPSFGIQFQPNLLRVMPQNKAQVLADFCESSVHGGSLLHAARPDTPYADIGQLLVRSGPIAIHEGLPRWKNRSVSLTSDPSTAPKMTPIHEIRRRQ